MVRSFIFYDLFDGRQESVSDNVGEFEVRFIQFSIQLYGIDNAHKSCKDLCPDRIVERVEYKVFGCNLKDRAREQGFCDDEVSFSVFCILDGNRTPVERDIFDSREYIDMGSSQ